MKHHRNRPFVGVDGEGGDINSRHEYLLLRVGDKALETGQPLQSREILEWLADLPTGDVEYVSYAFDYDVTMICRSLPEHLIRSLIDRESRTVEERPQPVSWGGLQFDYLPHQEFRVRWKGHDWVIISDVFTFFQCSFVKALRKWGIGDDVVLGQIESGKGQRAGFGLMTDEIRSYNVLEIELLEDLMTQFRAICQDIGYVPRQWQGPGRLAVAMMQRHKMPRTRDLPEIPREVLRYAQAAYYGGRFETTASGPVSGPVYQYDINSAYPWACTQLPCLACGRWVHGVLDKSYSVARIAFKSRPSTLYHFPVRRRDGSIFYPQSGYGWYWSPEVDAAAEAGCNITVYDTWSLEKRCECRPFEWIPEVYQERMRLGKTGKGIVLKLGLNSLYGKQAQSIGAAPYANLIYAGLITSLVRAQIIRAVSKDSGQCFMVATDGIFMDRGGISCTLSDQMGDWTVAAYPGMFIIQPGLYFLPDTEPKTRGVPLGKVLQYRDQFESVWNTSPWAMAYGARDVWQQGRSGADWPSVTIPLRSFIGLRLACARGGVDQAGSWPEVTKEISFDWSTKRRPYAVYRDQYGLRTTPYGGPATTIGYRRNIGGNLTRNLERLQWDDAPDWAEVLTVDG